ncbi:MAG: hypothetical protein ACQESB_06665, partial [Elusimicrobiota bacterium]
GDKMTADSRELNKAFYKTVKHFFPEFRKWLKSIDEPRKNKHSIIYSQKVLLWVGILLFMLKLKARRQINYIMTELTFVKNLSLLSKTALDKVPHDGTVEYFMKKLPPEKIENLITRMINRLIRMKTLTKFRIGGHYMVSIDGTGHLVFKERHCKHCLTKKKKGKIIYYYHNVLEAKLVTQTGVVLSMGTEFIENPHKRVTKQDCELKAFYRLAEKIKRSFPQLKICLLLDALYAGNPVFNICDRNNWKYLITFKEGSMPEGYQEYLSIIECQKMHKIEKKKTVETKDKKQQLRWVNDITFRGPAFSVLSCKETLRKKKTTDYLWLTNFNVSKSNCEILQRGGRLRWKIENEGFNIQKNGGYNLQHPYSMDEKAMKNYYLLMQIAHLLNQLMEQGSLFTDNVKKLFGSIKNFTTKLLMALVTSVLDPADIKHIDTSRFQITLRGP